MLRSDINLKKHITVSGKVFNEIVRIVFVAVGDEKVSIRLAIEAAWDEIAEILENSHVYDPLLIDPLAYAEHE